MTGLSWAVLGILQATAFRWPLALESPVGSAGLLAGLGFLSFSCGLRASPFHVASSQSQRQGSQTSDLWLRAHKNNRSKAEEADPTSTLKLRPGLAWSLPPRCVGQCLTDMLNVGEKGMRLALLGTIFRDELL